jgi:hypothetical protein
MPASQHVMFGIWTARRRRLVAIGNRQGIGRRGSSGLARGFFFTVRVRLRGAFFAGFFFAVAFAVVAGAFRLNDCASPVPVRNSATIIVSKPRQSTELANRISAHRTTQTRVAVRNGQRTCAARHFL